MNPHVYAITRTLRNPKQQQFPYVISLITQHNTRKHV